VVIKTAVLPKDERGNDPNDFVDDPDFLEKIEPAPNALSKLVALSTTNRIDEIEMNLKNDEYVFIDLALMGQMTLFYAAPNTGKTLLFIFMLIESIKAGRIKAEDIFYINADDNYKGIFIKSQVAKKHGFYMISPDEAGVSREKILEMLDDISAEGCAEGKIILLDTLKKFADMMSKSSQAALYNTLRRFIAKGGTVILAGHANKHKDIDGNLIYEGTSDTKNDVDCMYSMYQMSSPEDEKQIVEFRREKDRGEVIASVSYSYQKKKGMHYVQMLDSVQQLGQDEAQESEREMKHKSLTQKYEAEILFIRSTLKTGKKNQSEIIRAFDESEELKDELTKRSIKTTLKNLTNYEWKATRDKHNNALVFTLITSWNKSLPDTKSSDYERFSRGK
jgi:hypothetical protein